MQSSWDVFTATFNDAPAFVLVDSGLMAHAPLASHPDLVLCRIPVRELDERGFPTPAAFETIYEFEDRLNTIVGAADSHIYVGRLGMPQQVMFHIYSNRSEALIDVIKASEVLRSISEYRCDLMLDPTWDAYRDVLLPTPETRNNVENEKVRQGLRDNGDELTAPRVVDHFAFFNSMLGMVEFEIEVTQQGYDTIEAATLPDERGLLSFSFKKSQNPRDLDPVTWALSLLAEQHNGAYDGWACEVVRAKIS